MYIQNKWLFRYNQQPSFLVISLFFSIVTLLSYVLQYPIISAVDRFMTGDPGAALKADYLIAHGSLPTIDFGYNYGLLPLLLGRIWFDLFGRTPQTYLLAMLVINLLIALALARIAVAADLKLIGIIFIAITIPFSIMPSYPNQTHAIEALLICLALGEHIYGRRHYALMILVLNCFVKPSMSFVYIFFIILVYIYLFSKRALKLSEIVSQVLPSVLAVIFGLTLIAINFGFMPIFNSLFPLSGRESYKQSHFGFFTGIGRYFWHPPHATINYYLGTITGFWILGTIILTISVTYFLNRKIYLRNDGLKNSILEVQLCILFLHLSFVFIFFAHAWSWYYYSYLIPVGISLLMNRSFKGFKRGLGFLICILISVILVGYKSTYTGIYDSWYNTKPQKEILNLWASEDYKKEFLQVIESCQSDVLIYSQGALDLFFPKCVLPKSWFIPPGVFNNSDISRINQQLKHVKKLIILKNSNVLDVESMKPSFDKFQLDANHEYTKNFLYFNLKNNSK